MLRLLTSRQAESLTLAGWLFLAGLFFAELLSRAVSGEMFMDGTLYASVSRNLAIGVGTPWQPRFSATVFPVFHDHPPLQLWLQAAAFSAVGDNTYVERFYGVGAAVATALIAVALWRLFARDDGLRRFAGVPLIYVLAVTPISVVASNNLMENTLSLATMSAIYLIARAYRADARNGTAVRLGLIAGAALSTAAAVMTKGFVGLFPLAAIGFHWMALGRPGLWQAVSDTLVFKAIIVLVFGLLWLWPEPRNYMEHYFESQIVASLSGGRGNDGGGVSALIDLLKMLSRPLIVVFVLMVLALVVARIDQRRLPAKDGTSLATVGRPALFMLLVALSASLPILLSPRVYSFYFTPSMWFYAMAAALVSVPALRLLMMRIPASFAWIAVVAAAGYVLAAVLQLPSKIGEVRRDGDVLHDIRAMGDYVCPQREPCGVTLRVCESMFKSWGVHAYFQREYQVSLTRSKDDHDYVVSDGSCEPDGYVETDLKLRMYRLFERRETAATVR